MDAENFLKLREFSFQGAPNRWCKVVGVGKAHANIRQGHGDKAGDTVLVLVSPPLGE